MRIARVILRVSDLERSTAFWSRSVGFPVLWSTGEFAFLDAGATQLVLNRSGRAGADSLTEVVLEVEDVEAAYREMRGRGVPFEVDLRAVTSDGDRDLLASHFRDPDGNLASVTGWVDSG